MESPTDSLGFEAVQILRIENSTGEDDECKIVLDTEVLDRVLKSCGDRPLCIISIVGPTRSGKSYLANCIKEVLHAAEQKKTCMLKDLEELTGFSCKQQSCEPDTRGIWTWSRAFLVNGKFGEEVAVLVLDTQGFHDEYYTPEEMAAIFGITFLCSSTLILNVKHLIDDVTFETIGSFGGIIEDQFGTHDPFLGKLSLLIRDWSRPGEYEYGKKGGDKFLNENFEQAMLLQKLCHETSCFLLPHIGEDALTASFTGSLVGTNHDFATQLQNYVKSITRTVDLRCKTIFDNKIGAHEFRHFLAAFVEIYQTQPVSDIGDGLMDAIKKAAKALQVKKASSAYIGEYELQIMQMREPYFYEKHFLEIEAIAKRKALDAFKLFTIPIIEGSRVSTQEVANILQPLFAEQKTNNDEKKKRFLTHEESKACDQFRLEMDNKFPFPTETGSLPLTFYEKSVIQRSANELISKLKDQFLTKFPKDEIRHINCGELFKSLDIFLENTLAKNEENIARANELMEKTNEKLIGLHKAAMQKLLDRVPDADPSYLKFWHDETEARIRKKFDKLPIAENNAFLQENWKKIAKQLEANRRIAEERLGTALGILLDLAETEGQLYKQILFEKFRQLSETDVCQFHSEKSLDIVSTFLVKHNIAESSSNGKAAEERLRSILELSFLNAKEKSLSEKLMLTQILNQNFHTSLTAFKTELEDILEQGVVDDDDDELHANIDALASSQVQKFWDNCLDSEYKFEDEKITKKKYELISEMENLKTNLLDAHLKAKIGHQEKADALYAQCICDFESKMNQTLEQIDSMDDLEDLGKEFDSAKSEIFVTFREKAIGFSDSLTDTYIKRLGTRTAEIFAEIESIYNLKQNTENADWPRIVNETKDAYYTEMNRFFKDRTSGFSQAELMQIHSKAVCLALANCDQEAHLEPEKRDKLEIRLDAGLAKYASLNRTILQSHSEPAIGIDLGTTYCCVAVYRRGEVQIVTNSLGENTTPSYVTIEEDGNVVVGEHAKITAYRNPEATVYDAKRIIGRRMDDDVLQHDMKMWPFVIVEEEGKPKIQVHGQTYFPEEISAKLLQYLKKCTEDFLGQPVTKAVITVPAYFTDGQRQATKDAGNLAGLTVLGILNEPTAAALAYRYDKRQGDSVQNILVYDLGGGTFDVAILAISDDNMEVLSVAGDSHLGGEDFDRNTMEFCANKFKNSTQIDLFQRKESAIDTEKMNAKRNLRRLQERCEVSKKQLSTARSSVVDIGAFVDGHDLSISVKRKDFEECNLHLFEKTLNIVEEALEAAGLNKEDIDEIIVVGGSTRIPRLQAMLQKFFNDKGLNKSMNGDEAVARGAAIQAAILNSSDENPLIDFKCVQEITPMSLGVEISTGEFDIIIPRHTKIPLSLNQEYHTARDNQDTTSIRIYQGENNMARENKFLGQFTMLGIPPGPAGKETINVTMSIDRDGILHVKATITSTRKSKQITVTEDRGRIPEQMQQELRNQ